MKAVASRPQRLHVISAVYCSLTQVVLMTVTVAVSLGQELVPGDVFGVVKGLLLGVIRTGGDHDQVGRGDQAFLLGGEDGEGKGGRGGRGRRKGREGEEKGEGGRERGGEGRGGIEGRGGKGEREGDRDKDVDIQLLLQ